jgi:hypothetical protein
LSQKHLDDDVAGGVVAARSVQKRDNCGNPTKDGPDRAHKINHSRKGLSQRPAGLKKHGCDFVKHGFVSRLQRTAIALGATLLVGGCTLSHAPILDPKGLIALAEHDLMIPAAALMLMVLIPVFVLAFLFSWSFRASGRAPPKAITQFPKPMTPRRIRALDLVRAFLRRRAA